MKAMNVKTRHGLARAAVAVFALTPWWFTPSTARADGSIPTTAYVQDGLVFHLDGIENAGRNSHAESPTQIVDLIGGKTVDLAEGEQALVLSNSFTLTSAHAVAMTEELSVMPKNIQMDFVAKPAAKLTATTYFMNVANAANIAFLSSGRAVFAEYAQLKPSDSSFTQRDTRNFSHDYDDGSTLHDVAPLRCVLHWYRTNNIGTDLPFVYVNSASARAASSRGSMAAGSLTSDITLGSATTEIFYSVRVYTNALTASQRRLNDALDALRLCGASSNDVGYAWDTTSGSVQVGARVFVADGNSQYYGTASMTADGVAVPDGECFWAPVDDCENVDLVFTATPRPNCTFDHWEGDTSGLTDEQLAANPLQITAMGGGPRFLKAVFTGPTLAYWRGVGSTNPQNASNENNWYKNGENRAYYHPQDGDFIVFDASSDGKNLFWNIDIKPGGWFQPSNYTGTVTFQNGIVTEGYTVYGTETTETYEGTEYTVKETQIDGDVVLEGGTWTHTVQPKIANTHAQNMNGLGVYRLQVKASGNFTIANAVSVSARAKGFPSGYGPGRGTGKANGASHGGIGGDWAPAYGSSVAPVTNGSGGWNSAESGRTGGGVLRIQTAGKLTLDGAVDADGEYLDSNGYRQPSGGSVWITAGEIEGSGTVYARGTRGTAGTAASGGRISIVLTKSGADFSDFNTDNISALGGGATAKSVSASGPSSGTIYLARASDGPKGGTLIVRGNGTDICSIVSDQKIIDGSSYQYYTAITSNDQDVVFSSIIVTNGARLGIMSGANVATRDFRAQSKTKSELVFAGGRFGFASGYVISNCILACTSGGSVLNVFDDGDNDDDRSVTLSNVLFVINKPMEVEGTLVLDNKGILSHTQGPENILDLTVTNNFTILSGGSVNVQACGYTGNKGPTCLSTGGGAHGGSSYKAGASPMMTYGSVTNPNEHGSGGNGGVYAYGGGVIRLSVGATTTLGGNLVASGGYWQSWSGGSGAGGSVYLSTQRLKGSANILAEGGNSLSIGTGLASGGGRIAVTLNGDGADLSEFTGKISAQGQTSYERAYGGCGTVYLRKNGEGEHEGTLIVQNGSNPAQSSIGAIISTNVTDTWVGSVVISNKAVLAIQEGASLTVSKDWRLVEGGVFSNGVDTVTAEVETIPGGTVIFTNAAVASTVYGSSAFCHLACTEPGKTLNFEAAANVTNAVTGSLTLKGAKGNRVKVRSTEDGTKAFLCLASEATADVEQADVKYSDASSGKAIPTLNSRCYRCLNWLYDLPMKIIVQ